LVRNSALYASDAVAEGTETTAAAVADSAEAADNEAETARSGVVAAVS